MLLTIFAGCKTKKEKEIWNYEDDEITVDFRFIVETKIEGNRIYETINYYYIQDDEIVGTWNVVDFVDTINDFDPNEQKTDKKSLFLTRIKFFDVGTAALKYEGVEDERLEKWTDGYIVYERDKIVSKYTIKNIDDVEYMFVEWKSGDYAYYGFTPKYYVFKKASSRTIFVVPEYADVRSKDIHVADFSDEPRKILTLTFNEKTIFPPQEKLPSVYKFQPVPVMEAGMNPGLGVRALHEQGITGEGVSVAVIDWGILDLNHPEYKDCIAEYVSLSSNLLSFLGQTTLSLLAGKNIGTAPDAKVYYYSVLSYSEEEKIDAETYATALDMIIEKNKTLSENEKIRVVCVTIDPRNNDAFKNVDIYVESRKIAQETGILIIDVSIIGPCSYDFNNPEDVTKCKPGGERNNFWYTKTAILAPSCYRTTAESTRIGNYSYQYVGDGGAPSSVPYAAGVFALGWQVKPELTADEIVQILIDTAYVDVQGYKYINPPAFIEYIQNN